MEVKSFMEYVHQKRVEGKSDKQIATSLGMSLKHLNKMLSGSKPQEEKVVEKKPELPVVKIPEKKPEPIIEPEVPEVKEEPNETV